MCYVDIGIFFIWRLLKRKPVIDRIERRIIGLVIFLHPQKFFAECGTWYQLGQSVLAIAVALLFLQGL